jgi:NAD(P)-dependent dehydrogenase (short-subunit alcohol dehydrogenase family)
MPSAFDPSGSLFDLSGKVAIVTGSSRGIGRAIAERLAQHGAKVVVSSRTLADCEVVALGIRERGGEAFAHACNIGHKNELQSLVDAALTRWGAIDILVCNAAINPHYGPSLTIDDETYDKILNSNVRSNFWLCNMVLPQMAERGGGSIILISSVAGLFGSARLGVYGLSKAADMALARNICVEWGPKSIRANCIAPGLIRTEFARALWENPKIYEAVVKSYPLRRIGEPDEIAGAAVFLAAASGSFINGQTLVIDGGGMVSE